MFCLRNGVGDEEEKEEEGVIFEFLFCASDLAGRGRLVRKGQHVSFVAPASSSIYRLYNFFMVLITAPLFSAWSCGSPRGCDPNQVSHPTYCTSDDVYGWCCVHLSSLPVIGQIRLNSHIPYIVIPGDASSWNGVSLSVQRCYPVR